MKDDSTPATKADMHRLEAEMKTEMRQMANSLNQAIDQVLTVLVNIDKRLTGAVDSHEWRIKRLETRVGIAA
jgi:hypothetical protein